MQFPTKNIFTISNQEIFNKVALDVFKFQLENNKVYKEYIDLIGIDTSLVDNIYKIPFLPISLFKTKEIICSNLTPQIVFTSSSTTGMIPSKHYVADINVYKDSFNNSFSKFYGDIKDYTILALLPSYLEREGSSLVYMADSLIKSSNCKLSGFYLYNYKELYNNLILLKQTNKKVILLGVSFALLDFVEQYKIDFPSLIVMETGGMKGKREEITREQLHSKLKKGFGIDVIHSEYGMAELLSQAYSKGNGVFQTPQWMKIIIRDLNNPFNYYKENNKNGGINIIDLANVYSCSFIETEDAGVNLSYNSFLVNGRIKDSERRGCNMLIE